MDIDVDFKNREEALKLFPEATRASIIKNGKLLKHSVGIYFQDIPKDPIQGISSIDYKSAEKYGYFKIDFLNAAVYSAIENNEEVYELVDQEPPWELFEEDEVLDELFHLNSKYLKQICKDFKPKSVEELATVLALGRPGKQHLIGKTKSEIAKEIWDETDSYYFKKAHAVSYALAIIVQLNKMLDILS